MSNFVKNSLQKKGLHVLVFGSDEHAANTGSVQFTSLEYLTSHLKSLNVSIQYAYSEEEGLIAADIREGNVENLNHPIYHSSTEICFDLVIGQVIRFQLALFLDFSEVGVNQATIVVDKFFGHTRLGRGRAIRIH